MIANRNMPGSSAPKYTAIAISTARGLKDRRISTPHPPSDRRAALGAAGLDDAAQVVAAPAAARDAVARGAPEAQPVEEREDHGQRHEVDHHHLDHADDRYQPHRGLP